jgi:glycine oxidase
MSADRRSRDEPTHGSHASQEDVVIVGGGVIGMAIAHALVCEGLRVRVLEADAVGSGASGAAAGMLAPLSEAREGGPMLQLGLESLSRFGPLCDRLREETGIDPELEPSGLLRVAMSEAEEFELKQRCARLESDPAICSGAPSPSLEWLERGKICALEPAFSSVIQGGLLSPIEGHVRPPFFVQALEASARARGVMIETGVRAQLLLRQGDRMTGVETSAGRRNAGCVVVAAGPWTPGLLEASGLIDGAAGPPLIEPVRGQILSLEGPLPAIRQIVWGEGVYLVPKRDGSWVVGATEESVGFDRRVTAEGVAWLLEGARRIFPELAQASFGRAWAGLRPVSRDGLPWIGGLPDWRGLYLAAGHGRNGVLHSPMTAELIRNEILGQDNGASSRPFRASRLSEPAAS